MIIEISVIEPSVNWSITVVFLSLSKCQYQSYHSNQSQQEQTVRRTNQNYNNYQPTNLSAASVHEAFDVHTYSTRAFIKNSKLRSVIEQASHLQNRKWKSNQYIIIYLCRIRAIALSKCKLHAGTKTNGNVISVYLQQFVAFPHHWEHPSNPTRTAITNGKKKTNKQRTSEQISDTS